jgi:hypothetical protein
MSASCQVYLSTISFLNSQCLRTDFLRLEKLLDAVYNLAGREKHNMDASNVEQALTPEEAARFLNISVQKLARLRRQGKVQGTQIGKSNLYIYTVSNLRKADLSKEKRGPKPKKQDTDIVQNQF